MSTVTVILPVVILALAGYLAARANIIRAGDSEVLSRFVFAIALPALLFDSLAHVELPPGIDWVYLLAYYTVVLIIFWLGMWLSKRWFATPKQEQGIFGLGASYSNLMLVGLPIILAGLGEEALLPLFLLVSIHSAVLFLLTAILAEGGEWNRQNAAQLFNRSARTLIRNPIVIAITLGLLVNLLGIALPALLDEALSTLSTSALPLSLIVLGATLANYQIRGHIKEASLIVGLKLVAQPLLLWLLVVPILRLDPLWAAVSVMAAGMPVGVSAYIFAQNYDSGVAVLSTAVLLSTVLAVVSQSIWLMILT